MRDIYKFDIVDLAWLVGLLEGEGYFGFQDGNPALTVQRIAKSVGVNVR